MLYLRIICTEVRAWDLASSENEGDYTVGPCMKPKVVMVMFTLSMCNEATRGPDGVERRIKQTAQLDGKSVSIRLPQDPGQAGKSQAKKLHY